LLRRQALRDFSGPLKWSLLKKAEESGLASPDPEARRRLKYAVVKDREWLLEVEGEEQRDVAGGVTDAAEAESPGQ
jgi:hypothetical protein